MLISEGLFFQSWASVGQTDKNPQTFSFLLKLVGRIKEMFDFNDTAFFGAENDEMKKFTLKEKCDSIANIPKKNAKK